EPGEHGRKRNPGQDALDPCQEARRTWRDEVKSVQDGRALKLVRELGAGSAREGETQEPAHGQYGDGRERGAGERVGRRVDALLENPMAEGLAGGEPHARAEAAADDEDEHSTQRAGHEV